jgi:hypothetical protein
MSYHIYIHTYALAMKSNSYTRQCDIRHSSKNSSLQGVPLLLFPVYLSISKDFLTNESVRHANAPDSLLQRCSWPHLTSLNDISFLPTLIPLNIKMRCADRAASQSHRCVRLGTGAPRVRSRTRL